jgi:hypothetical protein
MTQLNAYFQGNLVACFHLLFVWNRSENEIFYSKVQLTSHVQSQIFLILKAKGLISQFSVSFVT